MFQDGPEETISSASAEAVPRPPRKFQPGIPKLPPEVIRPQQPRLTHSTRNTEHERPATPVALRMVDLALDNLAKQDWFHPLPLQRLQALLTLFPKSFSPFPHGTFMLSVLGPYLALDEIYHPFALQSQGTRLVGGRPYVTVSQARTGLSPFLARFSKRLSPAPPLVQPLKTTIQGQVPDFHPELFPLQSPLLRESWLVSLPPLTDMLKFSG